ncbi:cystatin-C [Denticeps clupeoides]|uniref:Si:busm1-57f23.1 n=1 Tax=Denticeps clupeoides TaxID=299321 RepID=A0AAY4AFR6_9TELE|nr:cystatin-C-like [Denticeps clupeoides]
MLLKFLKKKKKESLWGAERFWSRDNHNRPLHQAHITENMARRVLLLSTLLALVALVHVSHGIEEADEPLISASHVQLLGGWSTVNPEGSEIQEAAAKAVENFNTKSKAKKHFRLLQVTSAELQVTNKINYKIDTIIGKTSCLKSENKDVETCNLEKRQLQCKFDVQLNPRNDKHTVVASRCKKTSV